MRVVNTGWVLMVVLAFAAGLAVGIILESQQPSLESSMRWRVVSTEYVAGVGTTSLLRDTKSGVCVVVVDRVGVLTILPPETCR